MYVKMMNSDLCSDYHRTVSGEHYEVSPVRCCSFSSFTFQDVQAHPNNGDSRSDPLEGF